MTRPHRRIMQTTDAMSALARLSLLLQPLETQMGQLAPMTLQAVGLFRGSSRAAGKAFSSRTTPGISSNFSGYTARDVLSRSSAKVRYREGRKYARSGALQAMLLLYVAQDSCPRLSLDGCLTCYRVLFYAARWGAPCTSLLDSWAALQQQQCGGHHRPRDRPARPCGRGQ